MASSGWQGQKDIQTSKYPHMALNLNVWDVYHSGTTLTFKATVRAIVTSGNIYYNGVAVSLTGGGTITKNMNPVSSGGFVDFGTFSCTVTGVPAGSTTYSVTASLSAGSTASGSAAWTLNFSSSGLPPERGAGYITLDGMGWNYIDATSSVGNWGSQAGYMEAIALTGSSKADFATINSANWTSKGRSVWQRATSALSESFHMAMGTENFELDYPLTIKGMRHFYLVHYAKNDYGSDQGYCDWQVKYMPPAPSQFTYTDPGGSGTKVYPVSFVGDTDNARNSFTYDTQDLTRSVRYKIDNGQWVYVDNNTVALLDFVTSFNVSVPAGSVATIEGWMTYHGSQSEVSTITISNTNANVALYGSVNGQAKALGPVYASVNGRAKKLIKIYASVGGVTKKVYEDV